ncbi:MAG: glycoside hydrolase [Chthonomonadales bacterium]|nr:glycoside hydrolase [Chthonomonadales bacterium]
MAHSASTAPRASRADAAHGRAPRDERLFPTFFAAGYECATARIRDGRRIDELSTTGHDARAVADYRTLRALGIRTARDGVRWNLVDRGGRLDWSSAMPRVEAAERERITVIWDLFHYGYPDDLNPFERPFVERFARYCAAFAAMLVRRGHGGPVSGGPRRRFYTPVNEISFFSWAGGEVGRFAPFALRRGGELKRRLVEAAIQGINAIREVDPAARIANCDPIVRVVAPGDAPWLEEEAARFNEECVLEAWDMLAGLRAPELGGSSAHLDIVGVNYYGVNQWEHGRPERVLGDDDPRRAPLSALLRHLDARYEAPLFVSETASIGADRPRWLRGIGLECLEAIEHGVDLHGLCLYPVLGMHDWESGEYRAMGLWDVQPDMRRILHRPTAAALGDLQTWHRHASERRGRRAPAQAAQR